MGLTCAAGHVFLGALQQTAGGSDAESILDAVCGTLGYRRVEGRQAARCDLVAVFDDRWISFLDPGTPSLTRDLVAVARAFSAAAQRPVLLACVNDSDVLAFLVFHHGEPCDGYASRADLLPVSIPELPGEQRASRWSEWFSCPVTAEDARKVTQQGGLFADDQLSDLCRVIGLPIERATLDVTELDTTNARCACYCKTAAALGCKQTGGRHGFDKPGRRPLELFVGQTDSLCFEIAAPAEALSSPILELLGPAVEQRLIDVQSAEGVLHGGLDQVRTGGAQSFRGQVETQSEPKTIRVTADLPAESMPLTSGQQATLMYSIGLRATSAGSGELRCRFLPGSNLQTTLALSPEYKVAVSAPGWTPRGGVAPGVVEQDGFRRLNRPQILSAVLIHEDRGDKPSATLQTEIERWLSSRSWPTPHRVACEYEGQMDEQSYRVPRKEASFKSHEVGSTSKWRKLFDRPEELQSLFLQVQREDGEAVGGASIQRASAGEVTSDEGAIHFALWVATAESSGSDDLETDRARLTQFIDASFAPLRGLQAWIAHWDWVPRFSMAEENNYTPYEEACSTGRVATEDVPGRYMQSAWCANHLRAVSSRMWLGESLLARVDRDALDDVAMATDVVSSAVRIDLRPDHQLPDLEDALLPILPSSAREQPTDANG